MPKYKLNSIEKCSEFHYGVDVFEGGELVKSIGEITTNHKDIISIVDMCNELDIEVGQFDYIVEDYLTDFCI